MIEGGCTNLFCDTDGGRSFVGSGITNLSTARFRFLCPFDRHERIAMCVLLSPYSVQLSALYTCAP